MNIHNEPGRAYTRTHRKSQIAYTRNNRLDNSILRGRKIVCHLQFITFCFDSHTQSIAQPGRARCDTYTRVARARRTKETEKQKMKASERGNKKKEKRTTTCESHRLHIASAMAASGVRMK